MNIGIYGGSFNPIHLGHITAAVAAIRTLALDRLLLIPAGEPPHKALTADTPSPEHRLAMVRLAAEQIALETGIDVSVSDMEIKRDGKSYSSDTVRAVREENPDATLWLLMGTDMFLTFQYWHAPEQILHDCGICAFGRTEKDTEELFAPQRVFLQQKYPHSRITTVVLPNVVDVSSTELRAALPKGEGKKYLSPAVLGYILREQLYGTHTDLKHLTLDQLRPIALSYLKAKRIAHVLGTEKTAAELAERYGADVEKARFAALLHDCTKRLEMDEQKVLCRQYGIELDELENETVKLLHAKTGAWIARDVFGADDEIFTAIFYHTTGRRGMSLMEKVIYLADYIEPVRNFDGVEELRRAVYEDLDRGLLLGLQMSVEDMKQYGKQVHHNTMDACEEWKGLLL